MLDKQELQKSTVEWIKKYKRVILQWGTGLGKSKAAIDMTNYLINKKKNLNIKLNVLLVVAEVAHKNNWNDEFKKWNLEECNLNVDCYASLKKYKNSEFDLIIFDEAHHLGSDIRMEILSTIKTEYVILLSATLPDNIINYVSSLFGKFKISKVTLKQAITCGIMPKPKVYLIPLTLDDTNINCTIIEEWGISHKRVIYKCKYQERWEYIRNKNKYPNAILYIYCTPFQKYSYLTEQFEYWKKTYFKTRTDYAKNKWLQAGSNRKRFLGECKTKYVKELLDKIQDKRYICFCSSIEQASILGGEYAIHSKRDDSLSVITDFNNNKINNLFAVGMLQEGQNLSNIDLGIIVQLDGKERAFIQKFGRSMRADSPIQFIFYYKDTKDADYLKNVLEGVNEEYIMNIDNLNDFKL